MALKIKLTDGERTEVVDLYAHGYSTRRVIDHLISTHPDWQLAPRHQIKTAIRTCNPNHEKCAKKWKVRFEERKEHFRTHHDRLIETSAGHAAEVAFDGFLKLSEALNSITVSPTKVSVAKDTISLLRTLLDTVKIMNPIANPTEITGNSDSTTAMHRHLLDRLAVRDRQLPENSASPQSEAVVEDRSLTSDVDDNGGEHHGH